MPETKKRGRPAATLDEKQIAEVEALAGYLTRMQLADHLGICYNTYTAIEERQPEVADAYKRGLSRQIVDVSKNLLMHGKDGDTKALIFYLKAKAGWSESINVNAEVNSNVSLNIGGQSIDPEKLGW